MTDLTDSENNHAREMARKAVEILRREMHWAFPIRKDLIERECDQIQSELVETISIFIMENKA